MAEFQEIGYEIRKITICDEVPDEALGAYTEYLVQSVFPPKTTINIRGVVADGDAKILPKCRKRETAPKRTGAPRKTRDKPRGRGQAVLGRMVLLSMPENRPCIERRTYVPAGK